MGVGTSTPEETRPWTKSEGGKHPDFSRPPTLQAPLHVSLGQAWLEASGPGSCSPQGQALLVMPPRAGEADPWIWGEQTQGRASPTPRRGHALTTRFMHLPPCFSNKFGSDSFLTTFQNQKKKGVALELAKVRESGLDWSSYAFEAQTETSAAFGTQRPKLQ